MSSEVRGQRIHVADVTNRSPRPVRDVACRIKPLAVQDYDWEAALVGELVPFPGALEGMLREVPGAAKIPLIANTRRREMGVPVRHSRGRSPGRQDQSPVHR